MWTQGLSGRIDLLIERDRQSGENLQPRKEKP